MSAPSDIAQLAVVVGRQVRSREADVGAFTHQNLYAVVILWDSEALGQWNGWLTTRTHRSMCFSSKDLADSRFSGWLSTLPCWNPAALDSRGLHLVWHRPATDPAIHPPSSRTPTPAPIEWAGASQGTALIGLLCLVPGRRMAIRLPGRVAPRAAVA